LPYKPLSPSQTSATDNRKGISCAGSPDGPLALAVLGVGGLIAIRKWLDPFDDRGFVAGEWRNSDPLGRASMARDLVRRHVRAGMTAADVERLLGRGKEQQGIKGVDPYGNRMPGAATWAYYLGSWSTAGWDDAFLYVHFDKSGRVIRAEIQGG
jgi:MYXO-CTERM domain-containing protein